MLFRTSYVNVDAILRGACLLKYALKSGLIILLTLTMMDMKLIRDLLTNRTMQETNMDSPLFSPFIIYLINNLNVGMS